MPKVRIDLFITKNFSVYLCQNLGWMALQLYSSIYHVEKYRDAIAVLCSDCSIRVIKSFCNGFGSKYKVLASSI